MTDPWIPPRKEIFYKIVKDVIKIECFQNLGGLTTVRNGMDLNGAPIFAL